MRTNKVLLGRSYQLVCSLGGLLRCGDVMGQIWRSTCTSRGHRLLTYQEVKVERLIAPLLVGALGQWRWCGKRGWHLKHSWGRGWDETWNWAWTKETGVFPKTKKRTLACYWPLFKCKAIQTPLMTNWVQQQWNTLHAATYHLVSCVCWPAHGETSATNTRATWEATSEPIRISLIITIKSLKHSNWLASAPDEPGSKCWVFAALQPNKTCASLATHQGKSMFLWCC